MITNRARILVVLVNIFLFFSFSSHAQQAKADSGRVQYIQDAHITELMNKKEQINEKKDGKIKGYRVQIHFGSDRDKAKEIKVKFMQKYTDVPAYEKYEQPNFKIRVGDFRTRLDAFHFLKQLSADFPSSFIVQDDIEMKELVK